ncbi:hypothetical protein L1987_69337 [Smallanthus sonchifolius]|uniref:Uncharacterized protein n=1 Tax=Smallanthus sonchifolius TaxID=185202 RepID=A0ACB9BAA0_9ASTR|nr:hypothetical protein L1987_69337 [Smallanthus sonchifolius]
MERRSWLWRRKSSEGETESSGGSMSSHSERFSDDQIYSNQSFQSPEITSKAVLQPEELEGGVKVLSQKLSEALFNISIKEDLVKQHSKVAEEAVEGWEKAEKEVLALRQQVEVLTHRNSTLEDRVCHLDGALKECLRQLRQTREENDEAIEKKTSEWQTTKDELEKQLSYFRLQLQSAKKTEPSVEMAEKQNSALKLELASMAEELELRFIERELSNQAAEQASKLHLESVKKAAKFEAECRRLNAALRKALATNSSTDSQSVVDFKETNDFESNRTTPAMDINLMNDFLEMERLVALPKRDSSQNRRCEVEEALKRVEMEKHNVEITLSESENELKTSRNELKVAKSKLVKLEALLVNANDARETTEKELESVKATVNVLQERVKRSDLEVVELKSQLDIQRREAESRLQDAESQMATLEAELESKVDSLILKVDCLETETEKERGKMGSRCRDLEGELESLTLKLDSLETEVENERALSNKMVVKYLELEGEISRLQRENQYPKPEFVIKQDTELALAGSKFADCQKTIASLSHQLKTIATLEDLLIDTNEFSRLI